MRVRYGKPIKVKSLLGRCNVALAYSGASNITFYPKNNNSFNAGWNASSCKTVNRQANHKYFIYLKTNDFTYNWSYFGLWDTYSSGYDGNRAAPTEVGNGDYYTLISPTTSASTAVPTLQFGGTDSSANQIAYCSCIIDLTSTFGSGKEPTAQQFYNKYKDKLESLATGNEIVIDRGSGNISLYPRLPSAYQEVEYIESSGTQYIDTGVNANIGTKFVIDAQYLNINASEQISGKTWYNNGGCSIGYAKNASTTKFLSQAGASLVYAGTLDTNRHLFSLTIDSSSSATFQVDNEISTASISFTQSNNNLALFARTNSSNNHDNYCSLKFYNSKLYSNDILLRDYIPCYRKSDNVVGLFDLVNQVFYTNQGSGTFTKGNNVNNIQSCNPAVKMYGYNQKAMPMFSDYYYQEYNTGPTSARTFDINNNSTTYTADGSNMNFRLLSTDNFKLGVVKDHYYYVRAKFSWNTASAVITKMSNFSVLTSPGINVVNYGKTIINGEYFENIHQVTATGTARWVWSPLIDSGSVQTGDTFTTKDLIIIDLTDWFGEGKEPTTVAEFKEKFSKDYYGFCPTPIKLTQKMIENEPTYGYNQLIQFIQRNNYNGITWTPTTDGIYNLSGTSTNTYSSWGEQLVNEHKYMIYLNIISNPNNVQMKVGLLNVSYGSTEYITTGSVYKIVKYNTGDGKSFGIVYPSSGTNLNNMQIQVMCIDLTDWYGAGSEPTTIEEFKVTFPKKYYIYSKKRLLNKYMINKLAA